MSLYLAIDAGGTKADYLLADEAREIARVRSGSIKRMRVNEQTATDHLQEALTELAHVSGRSLRDVKRTCIGTAGETVPLVRDWLTHALGERVGGGLVLVGDVEIALDAAFEGGPGVLVLAGTGSNVAGRSVSGKLLRAGGWGPALSDQGSAHRIGLSGLRAAFLAMDERRPSQLMDAALRFWELNTMEALVAYGNSTPPPDFSKFSVPVHECALAGDEIAREVLDREGKELGYLARLVLRQVGAGAMGKPAAVAFAGSIMEKVPLVRRALMASVHEEFGDVSEVSGVVDPVMGALWRARQG